MGKGFRGVVHRPLRNADIMRPRLDNAVEPYDDGARIRDRLRDPIRANDDTTTAGLVEGKTLVDIILKNRGHGTDNVTTRDYIDYVLTAARRGGDTKRGS
jgi:hypothetical protein